MIRSILIWLGFAQPDGNESESHDHAPHGEGGHGHTHGVVDPTIATTTEGVWAVKWSFIILALTAAIQLTVVLW